MNTNSINQELYQIVKWALCSSAADCPDYSDWKIIKAELKKQTIYTLVADSVPEGAIDDSERLEILTAVAKNMRHCYQLLEAQTKVVTLLKDSDIPAAIMKGAAASQYYPKPELRLMGDIDIIVLPEDFDRAFNLLCASGYQNEQELKDSYRRHIGFRSVEGFEIELHRYFSSGRDKTKNALLDHWLYAQLRTTRQVNVCGYPVPVFPPLENGLILLGHINQHLSSGLGLRQMIDWYYYVQSELNDDFWNNAFKLKAEAIGMAKLAVVVTRMCQKYFGLTEQITWCMNAEEDLVDELMGYVMKKGNFGRKLESGENSTVTVLHSFSNLKDTFSYLTRGGICHMKAAGIKPIKAVAWLYQIGHLVRMTLKRKGHFSLKEEMKSAQEETVFLKRLEVTNL